MRCVDPHDIRCTREVSGPDPVCFFCQRVTETKIGIERAMEAYLDEPPLPIDSTERVVARTIRAKLDNLFAVHARQSLDMDGTIDATVVSLPQYTYTVTVR